MLLSQIYVQGCKCKQNCFVFKVAIVYVCVKIKLSLKWWLSLLTRNVALFLGPIEGSTFTTNLDARSLTTRVISWRAASVWTSLVADGCRWSKLGKSARQGNSSKACLKTAFFKRCLLLCLLNGLNVLSISPLEIYLQRHLAKVSLLKSPVPFIELTLTPVSTLRKVLLQKLLLITKGFVGLSSRYFKFSNI